MDKGPIHRQLDSGEELLWSGQPRQGVRASFEGEEPGFLLGSIGFLVFWFSLIGCITLRNARDGEGQLNVGTLIAGACFWTFGLAFMALALGHGVKDRAHTYYGLTDQRIIHITGIILPTVRSYPLDQLERMYIRTRGDGSGTVIFQDVTYPSNDQSLVLGFEKINNAQSVYDLIRAAQERRNGRDLP